MSAAEFRVARETLGYTQDALSAHLQCSRRSVANWEDGTRPVPGEVQDAMARLTRYTDGTVDGLVITLKNLPEPAVETYRDDDTVPSLWPGMPAAWHRAVVARVARQVPGLSITYAQSATPA